jgi:outer membrane protein
MKYILLIALFVIGASTASSQLKVGIVNLEEIGQNMAEAKDAEKIITELGKKYQDTLQQMQKQLETEYAAYQKQKSMMPQDQQQVKEQDLQAQQIALQQYYQDKMGQQGAIMQTRMELLAPIREKIDVAVSKVAKDEGLSIVLDKANPALLYSEDSLDITFKVLDKLKRGK